MEREVGEARTAAGNDATAHGAIERPGDGRSGAVAATVDARAVREAAARLRGAVRRTPVFDPAPVGAPLDRWRLAFKLEYLQVTGSFKARGALNRLLTLPCEQIAGGVVTASGGNHGLGVAYAAARLGVPATVFVPETTPEVKRERLRAQGAAVEVVGREYEVAAEAARALAARTGRPYIHAYADPAVIAGQGTVALELFEAVPDLDYLFVAVGGGGLIAGIAACAAEVSPGTRVVGVEPVGAATLHAALAAGRPAPLARVESIAADSLGARIVGEVNLAIAQRAVERVILVEDEAIQAAQALLWRELRIAVEPGAATALAGLLTPTAGVPAGARVGVILCGANLALPL